jgi:hypothetical protein
MHATFEMWSKADVWSFYRFMLAFIDDTAVWVMGKPPRGKGWSLDSSYRGDLGRWLEVEGTLARCGAETCVRARRVVLGATPREPER